MCLIPVVNKDSGIDVKCSWGAEAKPLTVCALQDERYAHLVGRHCTVPMSGGRCALHVVCKHHASMMPSPCLQGALLSALGIAQQSAEREDY